MEFKIIKFYASKKCFRKFYLRLKLTPCGHCKSTGFLVLHGYLYGYDESLSSSKKVRGHRIFCSNRENRLGCGRSFSVFKKAVIKGFSISSVTLWKFLSSTAHGMSRMQAFKRLNLHFSNSTIYRLYKAFHDRQCYIRTLLCSICPAPFLKDEQSSVIQTIFHLQAAFRQSLSPVSSFQNLFQVSFL